MKSKKIIATILSMAMLLPVMGNTVLADNGDADSEGNEFVELEEDEDIDDGESDDEDDSDDEDLEDDFDDEDDEDDEDLEDDSDDEDDEDDEDLEDDDDINDDDEDDDEDEDGEEIDEGDVGPVIEKDITPIPSVPKPLVKPIEKKGVEGFCERLYTCALNRSSDPTGIETWMNELESGRRDGASVAAGFFFSEEFINSKLSDEEFINRLYKTFMNRDADEEGYKTWTECLSKGWSREQVFQGFVDSQEWANVCFRYGIVSGGNATANITIEPSDEIIAFATRLYSTCLNRDGEPEGIENWSYALANRQVTGSMAAEGFFFSHELQSQKISDEEFVDRLYRTFMDREADSEGREMWLNLLKSGEYDRKAVFKGFADSQEFDNICKRYGIRR